MPIEGAGFEWDALDQPLDAPGLGAENQSSVGPRTVLAEEVSGMFPRMRASGRVVLVLAAAWTLAALARGDEPKAKVESAESRIEARLKADVLFLAADAQEGRAPGTKGIEAAAGYIAGEFKGLGLKPVPGGDGYFQPFTISGPAKLAKPPELAFAGTEGKTIDVGKEDFAPLAIGIGGTLDKTPIVFAGYGITAKGAAKNADYDDYADLDVKGKAVLILRREPRQGKDASVFGSAHPSDYATFRHKATNAFQHGAAAVLLANDLVSVRGAEPSKSNDRLLGFTMAGPEVNSALPFLMITRALADKLLAGAGLPNLEALEKRIDEDLKPESRELKGWSLHAKIEIERTAVETRNVVAMLEGSGPQAEETVVVGGHYDHLGRGGVFSGSLAFFSKDIHNGADDNASGTAMVLEMARRFARRPDPLPRRVVFMAFSGEEKGLLGSQHYVSAPLVPLDQTVMMINFDMVGRLNDKKELTMIGAGTLKGMEDLVKTLGQSSGMSVKTIAGLTDGFGGSDHQSFYAKNVPVLFAFTGVHKDYHRPTDDADLINYPGMARIADYCELLLLDLIRRPERPKFVKLPPPARRAAIAGGGDQARSGFRVSLGTMPDYAESDKGKGVKLAGVREGSPAEKGGLKAGDTIISYAGKPVSTVQDYMESLSRSQPGDVVELGVLRDGKETKLKVTLAGRGE